MGYNSKYSGKEIDEILDKAKSFVVADNTLDENSEQPIQNKVVAEEISQVKTSIQKVEDDLKELEISGGTHIVWEDVQ